MHEPKNKTRKSKKWLFFILATFLFIICAAGGLGFWYWTVNKDKIYLGVSAAGQNLGGLTQKQVFEVLDRQKETIIDTGINFIYKEQEINIPPALVATDPNLALSIFSFDIEKTAANAFMLGRDKNWAHNTLTQIKLMTQGRNLDIEYSLNEKELLSILQLNFDEAQRTPKNAALSIDASFHDIRVLEEQDGWVFEYEKAIEEVKRNLSQLVDSNVILNTKLANAEIAKEETERALLDVRQILSTTTPKLAYEKLQWQLTKKHVADFLGFYKDDDGKVGIQFNAKLLRAYLDENIAPNVDVEPIEARFELKDGRVTEFQPSNDGKKLNRDQSLEKINTFFFDKGRNEIELVVDIKKPKASTKDLNDLGIVELLARGHSNFTGSPTNRRHNIRVGTESANGILVAPGKDFSMLEALGEINDQHGYLQELVIKGDRTIPEYGGGLCQVSTTMFRAALKAGLPITARQNHSYRVVYYEPAGIDATIYYPAPDLKFKNDTPNHILIITKIEGDNLYYEIWGTKDGRIVEMPEKAEIYNITKPGSVKYVETDELPPGEKKRIERAINGADTRFNYKVTYPDGTAQEKTFTSHYVAWPEVWLVGRDTNATSTEVGEIDSTNE